MKTVLKVLAYNAIVLAVLFLVLEFVTRASGFYTPNNFVEEVNAYGEVMHFRRPNSSSLNKYEQENLAVYNNLGFHDLPHDGTDDAGKPNVAFFGDSFVEAVQLPTEQMFTARLAAACADSLEIFNFGVSGSGTANQYRLYHRLLSKGQRFDFVYVVLYPGNDFTDNNPRITTHPNYTLVADSTGAIRQVNRREYSLAQQVVRRLRSVSAFTNWIYEILYRSKRMNIAKRTKAEADAQEGGEEAGGGVPKPVPEAVPTDTSQAVTGGPAMGPVDTPMIAGLIRILDRWSGEVGKDRFRMMVIDQERFLRSNANLAAFLDSLRSIGIAAVPVDIPAAGHFYVHPKYDAAGQPVWKDYNYGHFNEAGHRRWTEIALQDLRAVGLR